MQLGLAIIIHTIWMFIPFTSEESFWSQISVNTIYKGVALKLPTVVIMLPKIPFDKISTEQRIEAMVERFLQ